MFLIQYGWRLEMFPVNCPLTVDEMPQSSAGWLYSTHVLSSVPADCRDVLWRRVLQQLWRCRADAADIPSQGGSAAEGLRAPPPPERTMQVAAVGWRIVDELVREAAQHAAEHGPHPVHLTMGRDGESAASEENGLEWYSGGRFGPLNSKQAKWNWITVGRPGRRENCGVGWLAFKVKLLSERRENFLRFVDWW